MFNITTFVESRSMDHQREFELFLASDYILDKQKMRCKPRLKHSQIANYTSLEKRRYHALSA